MNREDFEITRTAAPEIPKDKVVSHTPFRVIPGGKDSPTAGLQPGDHEHRLMQAAEGQLTDFRIVPVPSQEIGHRKPQGDDRYALHRGDFELQPGNKRERRNFGMREEAVIPRDARRIPQRDEKARAGERNGPGPSDMMHVSLSPTERVQEIRAARKRTVTHSTTAETEKRDAEIIARLRESMKQAGIVSVDDLNRDIASPAVAQHQKEISVLTEGAKGRATYKEQPAPKKRELTKEEIENLEKSRAESDAKLIEGGAEYTQAMDIDDQPIEGKQVLKLTDKQIEEASKEMAKSLENEALIAETPKLLATMDQKEINSIRASLKDLGMTGFDHQVAIIKKMLDREQRVTGRTLSHEEAIKIMREGIADPSFPKAEKYVRDLVEGAKGRPDHQGPKPRYTQEQIKKLEESRAESDAQLIKDGAEMVKTTDADGNETEVLHATAEQKEEARKEMEKDISIKEYAENVQKQLAEIGEARAADIQKSLKDEGMLGSDAQTVFVHRILDWYKKTSNRDIPMAEAIKIMREGVADPSYPKEEEYQRIIAEAAKARPDHHAPGPKYSQEQIKKLEESRAESDAQLIKDGAEMVKTTDADGNETEVLHAAEEQKEEARKEMEKDLSIKDYAEKVQKQLAEIETASVTNIQEVLRSQGMLGTDAQTVFVHRILDWYKKTANRDIPLEEAVQIMRAGVADPSYPKEEEYQKIIAEGAKIRTSYKEPISPRGKQYTKTEMDALDKSRAESDAELKEGGATYKTRRENGKFAKGPARLHITDEQWEAAHQEMEQDVSKRREEEEATDRHPSSADEEGTGVTSDMLTPDEIVTLRKKHDRELKVEGATFEQPRDDRGRYMDQKLVSLTDDQWDRMNAMNDAHTPTESGHDEAEEDVVSPPSEDRTEVHPEIDQPGQAQDIKSQLLKTGMRGTQSQVEYIQELMDSEKITLEEAVLRLKKEQDEGTRARVEAAVRPIARADAGEDHDEPEDETPHRNKQNKVFGWVKGIAGNAMSRVRRERPQPVPENERPQAADLSVDAGSADGNPEEQADVVPVDVDEPEAEDDDKPRPEPTSDAHPEKTTTDYDQAVSRFVTENDIELRGPELQRFTLYVKSNNRTDIEKAYDDYLKETAPAPLKVSETTQGKQSTTEPANADLSLISNFKKAPLFGIGRNRSEEVSTEAFRQAVDRLLDSGEDFSEYQSDPSQLQSSMNYRLAVELCHKQNQGLEIVQRGIKAMAASDPEFAKLLASAQGFMNDSEVAANFKDLWIWDKEKRHTPYYRGKIASVLLQTRRDIHPTHLANVLGIPEVRAFLKEALSKAA